jgi:hypothetical protein
MEADTFEEALLLARCHSFTQTPSMHADHLPYYATSVCRLLRAESLVVLDGATMTYILTSTGRLDS